MAYWFNLTLRGLTLKFKIIGQNSIKVMEKMLPKRLQQHYEWGLSSSK